MTGKRLLSSLSPSGIEGKRVFVRVDFNVPLLDGQITDDGRIRASLPTLKHLLSHGAKVVIGSHMGRPKGERKPEFSLAQIKDRLQELLEQSVAIASDCVGDVVQDQVNALANGEILLLENLRFHNEETANDEGFSKALASLADFYVLDAFGTAHRAHASTAGIATFIPGYAGFLIEKELEYLEPVLNNPTRPLVAIVGGSKVSSKIDVLDSLVNSADTIVIGGGMTYTFLKAQGHTIGSSLCEDDKCDVASAFLEKAKALNKKVILPLDHVVADAFSNDATIQTIDGDDLPEGYMGLDVGPKTIEVVKEEVSSAGSVIWNGPLGVFELSNFSKGTFEVAQSLADSNAISIVGGGDSAAAVRVANLSDKMTHISTGGGASLEFLEGKQLPGIMALSEG